MWVKPKLVALVAILAALGFHSGAAFASQPYPWQILMQPAVTPLANQAHELLNLLHGITAFITVIVVGLLAIVFVRFNAKANPVPSKNAHNTALEIVWTFIPILILVVIAVPSMKLIYAQDRVAEADMTIKATGHQWYWSYSYPDEGIEFEAYMLSEDELQEGQPRLLATDNNIVVPVGTTVRMLVTAGAEDVIHAWAMPAFGVKMDAVPGRLNETWFRVDTEGIYYGQCSELCGVYHGFMPITVEVVSPQAYQAWLVRAKEEFAADNGSADTEIASVDTGTAQ